VNVKEPGPAFTDMVDLAAERLGGRVLWADDDFFAEKENLLKAAAPVWMEGKYTDRGKWMDGWETRRRRTPGFDWCLIRLGLFGRVHGVVVDTSYFTGNYPERCVIEGCSAQESAEPEELESAATRWGTLLPESPLKGDSKNYFEISAPQRITHLRFKIFPDGGVARLRVHGIVLPDWPKILRGVPEIDLAAIEHGTRAVASSDRHYGNPNNLLLPGRGLHMGDGWETRRRRGPGHDWCILELGMPGIIRTIEVDTLHYKGNFPESCSLEGCLAPPSIETDLSDSTIAWHTLLPRTPLQADHLHRFDAQTPNEGNIPESAQEVTHVRLNMFPDGGIGRLRLFGAASGKAIETFGRGEA
jgi:allantoicase